jgi:hypothetical protein
LRDLGNHRSSPLYSTVVIALHCAYSIHSHENPAHRAAGHPEIENAAMCRSRPAAIERSWSRDNAPGTASANRSNRDKRRSKALRFAPSSPHFWPMGVEHELDV